MAQATSQAFDDTNDAGFEDMAGMATSITIPSGKKGDVMVVFCAENSVSSPGYIQVRAMAGGSLLSSPVYLDAATSVTNHCASFYKLNVPAGPRTVRMEWQAGTEASLWDRNIIVIVNIHN